MVSQKQACGKYGIIHGLQWSATPLMEVRWALQSDVRNLVKSGGYRVAEVSMMQCYSAYGPYRQEWERAAVEFYGYDGLNVLGLDMDSSFWTWNWW